MATEDDWTAYATAVVDLAPPDRAPLRVVPDDPDAVGEWPGGLAAPVVVVTAWNPGGRRLRAEENGVRHHALVAELAARGLDRWPATGREVPGGHHEEGVALPGLTEPEATALGRRFGQAAVYLWTPGAWEVVACTGNRRVTLGWRLVVVPTTPG
jgi:hypothetical protein